MTPAPPRLIAAATLEGGTGLEDAEFCRQLVTDEVTDEVTGEVTRTSGPLPSPDCCYVFIDTLYY